MNGADGGSAPKIAGREPNQVELLRGTVAELAETAIRVKNLSGLCRMGVVGYSSDEGKADEDVPNCHGILAITKQALEGSIEYLNSAEKDLLHLQEQLGELAQ